MLAQIVGFFLRSSRDCGCADPFQLIFWFNPVVQYYADTVAAMAQRQFLPGSPLRTLSLLLAGQPNEVFRESNVVTSPRSQPMQVPASSGNTTEVMDCQNPRVFTLWSLDFFNTFQFWRIEFSDEDLCGIGDQGGIGSMLEEWQENLSIMAANRTNGDDRVISHLGDCLWKFRGEVCSRKT